MARKRVLLSDSELDKTSFPAWRERIAAADADAGERDAPALRAYPGYPTWPLPRLRARPFARLDSALASRRITRALSVRLPEASALGRLLQYAHGAVDDHGRGPVPSAGGLQALELYVAVLDQGAWLPAGVYHYSRGAHVLAQVATGIDRAVWQDDLVPALATVEGGALLWLMVGDESRVAAKYGARSARFLLLEAGHLMQNVCLLAASMGLVTVPLGGFFETAIAAALALPATDTVLYAGVCGGPA